MTNKSKKDEILRGLSLIDGYYQRTLAMKEMVEGMKSLKERELDMLKKMQAEILAWESSDVHAKDSLSEMLKSLGDD